MVASTEKNLIIICNSGLSIATSRWSGEEKRFIMKPISWWVQLLCTQIRWKWSYKFPNELTCFCIYKRDIISWGFGCCFLGRKWVWTYDHGFLYNSECFFNNFHMEPWMLLCDTTSCPYFIQECLTDLAGPIRFGLTLQFFKSNRKQNENWENVNQ